MTRQKKWYLAHKEYYSTWRKKNKNRQHKIQKLWRQRNKEQYNANVKRHQRKKLLFINMLKDKPCTDCGIKYPPYVMHFDHRDPSKKIKSVSNLRCRSYKIIKEEIAKCDLVCANCHAKRTYFAIHSGTIRIFGGFICR